MSTVKELISCNANPDSVDKDGNTPLHWASFMGHESIVKFLCSCTSHINTQNKAGETPYYIACKEEHVGVLEPFRIPYKEDYLASLPITRVSVRLTLVFRS